MQVRLKPHHAPRFRTAQPPDERVSTLPLWGFRQTRPYTCGFATVLMVLHYFECAVSAWDLFRRLRTGRDGTRQNAIVRELRAGGVRANLRYDVDFARLRQEIDRNKLIVGYLHDVEHWLVIYGFGRLPDRLFVADPRPGEPCEQPWQDYGPRLAGFGIICSRPHESALRQVPLALPESAGADAAQLGGGRGDDDEADSLARLPPGLPAPQLRCDVHGYDDADFTVESPQLTLPF